MIDDSPFSCCLRPAAMLPGCHQTLTAVAVVVAEDLAAVAADDSARRNGSAVAAYVEDYFPSCFHPRTADTASLLRFHRDSNYRPCWEAIATAAAADGHGVVEAAAGTAGVQREEARDDSREENRMPLLSRHHATVHQGGLGFQKGSGSVP